MWILTETNSFEIKGFNLSHNDELWVTKNDNGSIKIASGELAHQMYDQLCEMATASRPVIMLKDNKFKTNMVEA